MTQIDWLRLLHSLEDGDRHNFLGTLSQSVQDELRFHWKLWARAEQLSSPGD